MRVSTWVFPLVAAILFIFIWFNRGTVVSPAGPDRLYEIKPEDVTYLKLVNAKGSITLEKDGRRWVVTEPVKTLADANSVEPLLQLLATSTHRRVIATSTLAKDSLEVWNLEPAAIRAVFRAGSKTYELLIGKDVAATNLAYARTSGLAQEPVKLVSQDLKRAMESGLTELRSLAVFDFDPRFATSMGVRTMNASGQVERECEVNVSARDWMLQKPVQARADRTKVRNWLNVLLGLTVTDFVTDTSPNPSTYGLSSPTAHLWATFSPENEQGLPDPSATATAKEVSLEIGSPVPDKPEYVYAWRPGTTSVFTISNVIVQQLLGGLADVRDRSIFPFKPDDVRKLAIKKGDRTYQLTENELSGWDITGDFSWRADKGRVQKLIKRILTEQAENFVKDTTTDLKAYGLDEPQARLTFGLQRENRKTTFDVNFGKQEQGAVYLRNSIEPTIYSVPDTFLKVLPSHPLELRHMQVINLNKDRFELLKVIKKTGTYTLQRDPKGVLQCDVKGFKTDLTRALEQVDVIPQLRAAQWVGLPEPEYGLDEPAIVVEISAEGKTEKLRIGTGTLPGGMHYAQLQGDAFVFALAAEDFVLLDSPPVTDYNPGEQGRPGIPAETNAPPRPRRPTDPEEDPDLPTEVPAAKSEGKKP
ncbi:MAG: DUF4340 domain-containing protein [Candidatus Methylacidiphilales bacterium]|nr:DUF4340 domain-containing protein [Candidatus Methylacidiphilales bacterium]